MLRGFDDDFMGTNAVHSVVDTIAGAVEIALHAQSRKLVGYYAGGPVGGIGVAAIGTKSQDLRRRLRLMACAKRTEAVCRPSHRHTNEITRALGTFDRNNHPPASHRIASQFRHKKLTILAQGSAESSPIERREASPSFCGRHRNDLIPLKIFATRTLAACISGH